MKPIIFLDIDGVLNTLTLIHEHRVYLHPTFSTRIRHVCNVTNADIVISSAWRMHPWEPLLRQLGDSGIEYIRIIGRTRGGGGIRGEQIQDYLDADCEPNTPYVIVDDASDMLPEQMDRLVHTSPYEGLTVPKMHDMIRVLLSQGCAVEPGAADTDNYTIPNF